MQTLTELVEYCNVENPVGALLLTGEWGCGKTYLIENLLKKELNKTHVIIRISMFGVPTVEEVHKAVKSAWIRQKGGLVDFVTKGSKFKSYIDSLKNLIPSDTAKTAIKSVLSIDFTDYVDIENTIGEKKVVLVFDDLERSELSHREKLGIINEYCENQHFNVIIIADEEKLKDDYSEIKEKVVQRTIHLEPDYSGVVGSVIATIKNEGYQKLLSDNKEALIGLFAGKDSEGKPLDEESRKKIELNAGQYSDKENRRREKLLQKRPHNIRSLKSAIQDFERVFRILDENSVSDLNRWLLSFLSFSISAKADLLTDNRDDDSIWCLPGQNDVDFLYPGYYDYRFMPRVISSWILEGSWDEEEIQEYIKEHIKTPDQLSPKEQVVYSRIDYLEESAAIQGMKDILLDAYAGNLTLNGYVIFVINSMLVRYYNLTELEIDWEEVYKGIENRLDTIVQNREEIKLHHAITNLEGFSDEEIKAYKMIKEAWDKSLPMFEINRAEYIDLFRNNPSEAFMKVSNKRFNRFDTEMADATLEGYRKVDNATKGSYPGYFETIWKSYTQSFDIDEEGIKKSREGFRALQDGLNNLLEEYKELPFKKRFTKAFIDVVDKLLDSEVES